MSGRREDIQNSDVLDSHKAMLIQKKPEHYMGIFGDVREFDDYVWPV